MTRPVFQLPEHLSERIVTHCLAALPNEGCGLLAMDADRVVEVYPATNAAGSPVAYTVPPDEHFAALEHAETRGWRLGGVFHSHPYDSAEMSTIDLETAIEPEWIYLVVGMRDRPRIRAWRVRDAHVEEVEILGRGRRRT